VAILVVSILKEPHRGGAGREKTVHASRSSA
jgi:hypothetical protein